MGLFDRIKKAVKEAVDDSIGDTIEGLTDSLKDMRESFADLRNEATSMFSDLQSETSSILGKKPAAKPSEKPAAKPEAKPAAKPEAKPEPVKTLTPKQMTAKSILGAVEKSVKSMPVESSAEMDDEGDILVKIQDWPDGTNPMSVWLYVDENLITFDSRMQGLPDGMDLDRIKALENYSGSNATDKVFADKKGNLHIVKYLPTSNLTAEDGHKYVTYIMSKLYNNWDEAIKASGVKFTFTTDDMIKVANCIGSNAEADSDGDVKLSFPATDSFNINRTLWFLIKPDKTTLQLVMKVPGNVDAAHDALKQMTLPEGVTSSVSDDGYVRFNTTLYADDFTSLLSFGTKVAEVTKLLGRQTAELCRKTGHDYVNRGFKFTTDTIIGLLKSDGVTDYEVDSDGDVRVDYSRALDEHFKWFAWYMLSGKQIIIDSGSTEISSLFNMKDLVDNINNSGFGKYITATINDKGNLRLKGCVDGNTEDKDEVISKWSEIGIALNHAWRMISELGNDLEEDRRQKRLRREAEQERRSHNSYDDEEEEERPRRSSRSSERSSVSAASEEKARKAAEKKKINEKIERLQDRIKDMEGNITPYVNNLELYKRRPNKNADHIEGMKKEIARRKAEIKKLKDEIAELRRKRASI